ncbi:MAG TPA: sugar ABC transporter ATP-binding protein [Acidobacteriota bacterium]|jgi:rhamnose transport system ATP-binding protein|nr:sugar ABC transporter ATP-binding protein [Acidobacteriota bacterium]
MSLLNAVSLTKSFAGVHALNGVSFELREAEVHALVGENGAGKSTLIKIITGATEADSGRLEVRGRAIANHNPALAKSLGIAAIYQQPALFPELTVAENIALGAEQAGFWRRIDWTKRKSRAKELLKRINASIDPETLVSSLTMPEQQLVEIARALGADANILVMDEPTASLTDQEVGSLFGVIRELRAQQVGVIYISHRLDELFTIADRVTVLRDGDAITTRPMGEVDRPELIRLMVGRELSAVFPKRTVPVGETLLETRHLGCSAWRIRDVSLSVRAGEILGLAGLVGSGRSALACALFGLNPADEGQLLLRGKEVKIVNPTQAVRHGIAYVPEDRRRHGVILEMAVSVNTTLAILRTISKFGFLDFRAERAIAADFTKRLAVKTPSLFAPVGNLSGGNQQKVSLGRWLATNPSVIILDEPTQGIDVGAKAEIHRLMVDLAGRGLGVIMISSELPEILGMSDRIAVMHEGTIAGILERADATQEKVLALALGKN